jgi:hypothetical protein
MVANLHRELRVLEKCVKEKRDELEAAEALLALKGIKKAKPKIPAFLWTENDGVAAEVKKALAAQNFAVTVAGKPGKGRRDVLWNLTAQKELRYAAVVLSPPKGKGGGTSSDGLLVAGYLAGRLGRGRVVVLLEGSGELAGAAGFLRAFPLKDTAAWQQEIAGDVAKLRP